MAWHHFRIDKQITMDKKENKGGLLTNEEVEQDLK
jgi:hypothetical protein